VSANEQKIVSVGSIIALATIGSFLASSAYVLGLSLGLQQPIYQFFEIRDYLEVTPVWLVPTAAYLLIIASLLYLLSPLIFKDQDAVRVKRRIYYIWFWSLILSYVVLFAVAIITKGSFQFWEALSGTVVVTAAWWGFHSVYTIVDRMGRLAPVQKPVRIVTYASITGFFVASTMGFNWVPQWITLTKESTVTVGDPKDITGEKELHGKLILHLDRYLLLQEKNGDLLGISASEVKRIDTPKPF
jgi:hypothetical protein